MKMEVLMNFLDLVEEFKFFNGISRKPELIFIFGGILCLKGYLIFLVFSTYNWNFLDHYLVDSIKTDAQVDVVV